MKKFAHVSRVKAGTVLVADGGFTCIKEGAKKKVRRDKSGGLYVLCKEGRHYLDGQLGWRPDTIGQYVGFYRG